MNAKDFLEKCPIIVYEDGEFKVAKSKPEEGRLVLRASVEFGVEHEVGRISRMKRVTYKTEDGKISVSVIGALPMEPSYFAEEAINYLEGRFL